ncbi:hypothetical protein RHGRI_020053 [Rhododendron griersonianum]|uniref:Uncharacterized protein n=1 Tax=Rhododendron griersonianum TaxID=479676 RepID=A0AAV6JF02_9ERIC|nr:hypothetical protein RHGRI_020053 [Rhododendron griersonianum]
MDATPKSKLPLARGVLAAEGQPLKNNAALRPRRADNRSEAANNQTRTQKTNQMQIISPPPHPPDLGETQTGNKAGPKRTAGENRTKTKPLQKGKTLTPTPHYYLDAGHHSSDLRGRG